jgi:glycosyltransferase involved in cell wall biosynthesis
VTDGSTEMRVLQVIDSFSYGGAERLLATLNGVAPEFGLDLAVASLSPYTVERTASLPLLDAAGLRPSFVGVRKLLDRRAVPKLVAAIRESGCDVVHAHLGTSATLVPLAAGIAGVPCISTLHHLPRRQPVLRDRVKSRLCVRAAERGHALVFVSEAARASAERLFGPPRPSWRVLHNGVDLSAFRPPAGATPEPLPTDLGIPAGVPVVTIVAALREPKGHEVALRAWPGVRERVPGATLLIVGDGPHRDVLAGLAGEGVVFAGAREDVPAILRGSTLALLPSLTEALPTSMIEAAATGLAGVATTVGGTPEIVEHGRSGLLVERGDAPALCDTVTALLLDPARRARYGAQARRLAEDRFDLRRWAGRLSALYDDALTARRARTRVRRATEQREAT